MELIEDHQWWHNLHERIAVFALIFAGLSATVVGIWKMATFTRRFATKEELALQENKGRKELEACNVAVQGQVKDMDSKLTNIDRDNSVKHEELSRELGEVSGKIDVLIARDG